MEAASTEKLMKDMKNVVTDAEELLKATAGQAGERVEKARARVEESLRSARARVNDTGAAFAERAREAANSVDEQVHRSPWTAIGVAAGVGMVIGVLLGRR